ncbi:unnamed protein product [Phytomonas sp. EM1]|nr:unnamed protein product [Phytomonas sp. EM1]|eukprot:CCW60864.1 unnamed protein product [Phytomonas sp. isolate EM1]
MTDPSIQKRITYLFFGAHGVIFGMFAYVAFLIWRRSDQALIQVNDPYTNEIQIKKTWEYDAGKLCELFFMKVGVSAGLGYFLASYFTFPLSIILQSVYNPLMVWNSELFKLYALGKDAEGALARPWPDATSLPPWLTDLWTHSKDETKSILAQQNEGGKAANRSSKKRK